MSEGVYTSGSSVPLSMWWKRNGEGKSVVDQVALDALGAVEAPSLEARSNLALGLVAFNVESAGNRQAVDASLSLANAASACEGEGKGTEAQVSAPLNENLQQTLYSQELSDAVVSMHSKPPDGRGQAVSPAGQV